MSPADPLTKLEDHRIRLEARIARQSIVRASLWVAIYLILGAILTDALGRAHIPAVVLAILAFSLLIAINVLQGCTTYSHSMKRNLRETITLQDKMIADDQR